MPKKKAERQVNIKVGNISGVRGEVNIAGRDIITNRTTNGLSPVEIRQLFDSLYSAIETNANTSTDNKRDLKAEVKEIQVTVAKAAQKNTKMDEGFLSHRFRHIARMSPDILDVVVATLTNPLAGLGVAVKKIAEKAKEEIK